MCDYDKALQLLKRESKDLLDTIENGNPNDDSMMASLYGWVQHEVCQRLRETILTKYAGDLSVVYTGELRGFDDYETIGDFLDNPVPLEIEDDVEDLDAEFNEWLVGEVESWAEVLVFELDCFEEAEDIFWEFVSDHGGSYMIDRIYHYMRSLPFRDVFEGAVDVLDRELRRSRHQRSVDVPRGSAAISIEVLDECN